MIVMAIIGGAAFTALMGLISDQTHSIANAMFVPAACFGIVALFAATHLRDRFAQ
jgi:FHS family L-fucose permease-like MFS transporter